MVVDFISDLARFSVCVDIEGNPHKFNHYPTGSVAFRSPTVRMGFLVVADQSVESTFVS